MSFDCVYFLKLCSTIRINCPSSSSSSSSSCFSFSGKPSCLSCVKLNLPCQYPVITRKRGPEAGVVKRLRQEVRLLESQLMKERTGKSSNTGEDKTDTVKIEPNDFDGNSSKTTQT